MKSFLLILLLNACQAFNISSWYVGNHDLNYYPIEKIRWDIITHIHNTNSLHVLKNGTAFVIAVFGSNFLSKKSKSGCDAAICSAASNACRLVASGFAFIHWRCHERAGPDPASNLGASVSIWLIFIVVSQCIFNIFIYYRPNIQLQTHVLQGNY